VLVMNRLVINTDIEKSGVFIAKPSMTEASKYALEQCDYNVSEFDPAIGTCSNPTSLLIVIQSNGKYEVIGNIVLFNMMVFKKPDDAIVYPWICDQFEIGIRIFKTHNLGKGYGTNAILLACEYGKNMFHAKFAVLKVLLTNQRAIKSYRKAGFKYWMTQVISGHQMVSMYKEL